jgi:hypothetical protein
MFKNAPGIFVGHSGTSPAWFNCNIYIRVTPPLAAVTIAMGLPKGRSAALPLGRHRGTYTDGEINLIYSGIFKIILQEIITD